jgi:hypothetical protein
MEMEQAHVEERPIKAPVIEIFDLSSDDGSAAGDMGSTSNTGGEDTSGGEENDSEDDEGDAWEAESLYADALDGAGDDQLFDGGKIVFAMPWLPTDKLHYRRRRVHTRGIQRIPKAASRHWPRKILCRDCSSWEHKCKETLYSLWDSPPCISQWHARL